MTRFGTRLGYFGLACLLSLSSLAAPALAAGGGASALEGLGGAPVADATPIPLPRFYARHVEEGNKLLAQDRISDAMNEFFAAKTINPDYYPTFIGIGDGYRKLYQHDEAVKSYQTALRLLNPSYASERLLRGNAFADKRRYKEALQQYGDVLRIDPAAGNQYTLAMKHLRHDEGKKAQKAFEAAISLDDDYADPHFQLGLMNYRDKKYKKSTPSYENAVRLDPANPLYRFALGTSYYKEGTAKREPDLKTIAKATHEYEEARRLNLRVPRLHHNLGTCYILMKNYDGAVNELRAAVREGLQDNPETFYNLGNALFLKGMTVNYTWDGLSSLTDVNKLKLNNEKFKYLHKAVSSYAMALRYDPKYAQVYYDQGVAYYRLSELKLTEPFMDAMLSDKASQKGYLDKGVKFFQEDMLAKSLISFDSFLTLSDDAKLKDSVSKIIPGLQRQLKAIGGKVIANKH